MQSSTVTRRTALATVGVTLAASGLVPKPLRAQNRTDVLVVGAGLSGLNAALLLEEQGFKVQVIEGRDRIGGRLLSLRDIPGNPEAGGNGIGSGYGRMIDTVERLEIPMLNSAGRAQITPFELYLDGERISGEQWPTHPRNILPEAFKAFSPRLVPLVLLRQTNPLASFEDWYDPKSKPHDISVYDVFKKNGFTDDQIDLTFNLNVSYGTSAHDVSALMMWFNDGWVASMEGGPPTQLSAIGGNMTIPETMAKALSGEVHLEREVVGVRQDGNGAEVVCADGTVYKADHVVSSLPLPVMRYIKFDPFLPSVQSKAISMVPYFPMTQVHLVAKDPFWEDDEWSPDMWTDTVAGHVIANRHNVNNSDVTSLTAWARGFTAHKLDQVSPEEGMAWVVSEFERIRPSAKGKLESRYIKSWMRDPFAGGDYAVWQPGQVTEFLHATGQAHGRVHFCGEHTALSNRGMEGAMESGERAAFEIMNI
ncbi:MAG: FAD-dependent oxidoreductase [Rhodospirillaceae bacterium]|nr:FAD-dependent oxidoreductase [Rhodospirillaceae bacterium]